MSDKIIVRKYSEQEKPHVVWAELELSREEATLLDSDRNHFMQSGCEGDRYRKVYYCPNGAAAVVYQSKTERTIFNDPNRLGWSQRYIKFAGTESAIDEITKKLENAGAKLKLEERLESELLTQ